MKEIVKKEEIRAAINDIPQEILADALALFLDRENIPNQSVTDMGKPELVNFAQAIQYLKKNYDFEELDYFTSEADLVYVHTGERRILLTDKMNRIPVSEMERGNSKQRAAIREAFPGVSVKDGHPQEAPHPTADEGRFSNLEI
jgi:hypothetical protein